MLTPIEQILFFVLALLSVGAAYHGFRQMWLIINRGEGQLHLDKLITRAWRALRVYISQTTTLKTRKLTSLIHLGVVWGFTFYFLVNALDLTLGYFAGFEDTLKRFGLLYDLYRLAADTLTVAVLTGMAYFLLRRFYLPNKKDLAFHDNVLLHPKVKTAAIHRDSVIVVAFILFHVGARFLGEAVYVAQHDPDIWMPFATLVSPVFEGMSADTQTLLRHGFWWGALGGIFLFLPYFPYTKHAHLFMAPLNYLTRPERTSLGEMESIDFDDDEKEQFGAHLLEHLPKTGIFDAFACIMCNRCQDVCPAYVTGKELSPSALEVNKRFLIKDLLHELDAGVGEHNRAPMPMPQTPLIGSVISQSAVWSCTTCAACIDICPVGNEPMLDILEIRRDLVLTQGDFPGELQAAFNGMERQGNPWQIGESRTAWTQGLDFAVPTVEQVPDFELLYWVGCAASFDPRAQQVARALVKVLHAAGVNFAILGEAESCTGDTARRAGNEYLYFEMASANVETLNAVNPPRIVTTCPHCFHNLGKEYHQLGGDYTVIHHTELITELIAAGKLPLSDLPTSRSNVTFHDPCYLGRQNGVIDAPRNVLERLGSPITEMPRSGKNSFCCGAGGAQFWKEEEEGEAAVNVTRYEEAKDTGAQTVATGCPFCMQMFDTAKTEIPDGPVVKDIAELVAEQLEG